MRAGTIPEGLSAMSKLQRLHLSSNKLTGTVLFFQLQQCVTVNNNLDAGLGTVPSEIFSLTELTGLGLGHNLYAAGTALP